MTKAELEQKVVAIMKAHQAGHTNLQHAHSKLCNVLADYFADTSCNPPLQTTEVAGIVLRRVGAATDPLPTVQVLAKRGDGKYFDVMCESVEGDLNHHITAAGIAKIFETNTPVT